MSEEKNPFNGINHKIAELEKKLNKIENLYMNVKDWKDHKERIEKLEKKMDNLWEVKEGQITECRERIEKLEKADKECSNTHIKYQAKFTKELSELKEQIKALGGYSNQYAYEISNMEDVLREFIKGIWGIKENDSEYESYEALYKYILNMLGGENAGSARQTDWDCDTCRFKDHGRYSGFPKNSPCEPCHNGSEWKPIEERPPDATDNKLGGEKPPSCKICSTLLINREVGWYCIKCENYYSEDELQFENPSEQDVCDKCGETNPEPLSECKPKEVVDSGYNIYDAKMILVEGYEIVVKKADLEWIFSNAVPFQYEGKKQKWRILTEKYQKKLTESGSGGEF